jgi:hypothetical protein
MRTLPPTNLEHVLLGLRRRGLEARANWYQDGKCLEPPVGEVRRHPDTHILVWWCERDPDPDGWQAREPQGE